MASYVTVKNLNGTSDNTAPDVSWKAFWEHKKDEKFNKCSNIDCKNNAEVGAHIQKSNSVDRKWYIVPLCMQCNNSLNNIEFKVRLEDLVSVK